MNKQEPSIEPVFEGPILEEVIEEVIEEVDVPFIMDKIAKCESGAKQHYKDGTVVMSPTSDVGYFQINQVHWDRAEELGIDLWTLEGKVKFANLLYNESGTGPWYMSKHCWNPDLT